MNKFVVTCLESHSKVFDARTFNRKRGGFSSSVVTEVTENGPTIWGVKHSPFNRELSIFLGGDGTLSMHKYTYPKQRRLQLNEKVSASVTSVKLTYLWNQKYPRNPSTRSIGTKTKKVSHFVRLSIREFVYSSSPV